MIIYIYFVKFLVLTGSGDKTARAYDAKSGSCKRIFRGHTGSVNALIVRCLILKFRITFLLHA